MEIQEVVEKTYRLAVALPDFSAFLSVYLLPEGVLIEPGLAATIPHIQEGMKALGMEKLSYVSLTHIHLDHGGGRWRAWPSSSPSRWWWCTLRGQSTLLTPSRLIEGTREAFGSQYEGLYGPILPVPQERVMAPQDGEVIFIGGRRLQIVYTPGHAPHHISIFDLGTGALFCGEALGFLGHSEEVPLPSASPPGIDLEAYLKSIDKLQALKPRVLLYSHGGVGRDPQRLMAQVRENAQIYGDIVLQGLEAGQGKEGIARRLQEKFGLPVEGVESVMSLSGYILYHRKRGLPGA